MTSVGVVNENSVRHSLSNALAQGVVQLVDDQGLRPGDQLETVKTLADRFNVAVPTMREALRRLEGLGVVQFRHGSGVYVGENSGRRVLANPLPPGPNLAQLLELLEARLHVEPQLAAMAARVREPRGLALMNQSLGLAKEQVIAGNDLLWKTNLDFHRAVAVASGNSILAEVIDSIVLVHAESQRAILRIHGDADEDHLEHIAMFEAVSSGDEQRAQDVTYKHLSHVIEIVSSRG